MSFFGQKDFWLEVAKGNVPGHGGIEKFGENDDVDTGAFETVWDGGGIYVPPTATRIHTVVSTSALDAGTVVSSGTATGGSLTTLVDSGATFISDGVAVGDDLLNDTKILIGRVTAIPSETTLTLAGSIREPDFGFISLEPNESGDTYRVVTNASTGVSIYYVIGLGGALQLQREFTVLNGTTGVVQTKSFTRQFRARVYGPGTGPDIDAVGTITSTAAVDGTITSQIVNGNNQTLMAVSTVPFPENGFLLSWWASLSRKITALCTIKLLAGDLNTRMYTIATRTITSSADSSFFQPYEGRRPLTGGIDLVMVTDTDTNNTGVSGGFTYGLVDK